MSALGGSFTGTGAGGAFALPGAGNLGVRLWGTFVADVAFQKSYDAGATWVTVKTYTEADDEIYEEVESEVRFRFNCTAFTSGTVNWRLAAKR